MRQNELQMRRGNFVFLSLSFSVFPRVSKECVCIDVYLLARAGEGEGRERHGHKQRYRLFNEEGTRNVLLLLSTCTPDIVSTLLLHNYVLSAY